MLGKQSLENKRKMIVKMQNITLTNSKFQLKPLHDDTSKTMDFETV